jgi:hypothetical protein
MTSTVGAGLDRGLRCTGKAGPSPCTPGLMTSARAEPATGALSTPIADAGADAPAGALSPEAPLHGLPRSSTATTVSGGC